MDLARAYVVDETGSTRMERIGNNAGSWGFWFATSQTSLLTGHLDWEPLNRVGLLDANSH